MNRPFVKRDRYSSHALINKDSFLELVERLRQLEFKNISVKIPIIQISDTKISATKANKLNYTVKEFLNEEKNFNSIVLNAESSRNKEKVSILFKNRHEDKLSFQDEVFPYADKNLNFNFMVSTFDPSKTYGLSLFIKDYFNSKINNQDLTIVIAIAMFSILGLMLYILTVVKGISLLLIILPMILVIFILLQFLPKTGFT